MRTRADYEKAIAPLSGKAREDVALDYFVKSDRPGYLTAWVPITLTEGARTLTVWVSPDVFAVGTDLDPFFVPLWPTTAQAIADVAKAILPSRKLAREIYKQADVKLSLYDSNPGEPWYDMKAGTPRRIENSGAWIASNQKKVAAVMLNLAGRSRSSILIAGHSKDVITGPTLDGSRVRIYGGGGGKVDGWAVQPPSTIHEWSYSDYSHSARLVLRDAVLVEGGSTKSVDLLDVFQNPALASLVSDEGPYNPRIPAPKAAS